MVSVKKLQFYHRPQESIFNEEEHGQAVDRFLFFFETRKTILGFKIQPCLAVIVFCVLIHITCTYCYHGICSVAGVSKRR